jgi:hypothetical protein
MKPAEKLTRRLVKTILMILAFTVAFVFGELSLHMGWFGAVIFIAGGLIAAFGEYLWRRLRN